MSFYPERLIQVRKSLGLNKAEAAKILNMSAMGYGRYENGQRTPSYQTICFIAQAFNTSPEFLCGENNDSSPRTITVDQAVSPELFNMLEAINSDNSIKERLLTYYSKLKAK
jgi:transcriptional regulator with XRE-family HTH domain